MAFPPPGMRPPLTIDKMKTNKILLRDKYPEFFANPKDPTGLSEKELNKMGWYKEK